MKIFISHYHGDKTLADTLRDLLKKVFGNQIDILYSSDTASGGGIKPGERWQDWILEQVKSADHTLVLLTPDSLAKPWVLWESGAVAGVALAKGENAKSPVVPLFYRIRPDDIPDPLQSLNASDGNTKEGMLRVLATLNDSCRQFDAGVAFADFMETPINGYLQSIGRALADRPLQLNEADILEWTSRLDALRASKRTAEVEHIHQALRIVFTAGGADATPLDLRLHRRLGEMYLENKKGSEAIKQFELGMKISSPKDVFLLHQLALAQLQANNWGMAMEVFKKIQELDPTMPENNPEIAGLKGRLYWEKYERENNMEALEIAREAYWTAMEKNPGSYFIADMTGQICLLLGQVQDARKAYENAIKAIEELNERSIWSFATLATASYVLEKPQECLENLHEVARMRPTDRQLETIERGLKRLKDARNVPDVTYSEWIETLRKK